MNDSAHIRLTEEAREAIRNYLWSYVKRMFLLLGLVNLAAVIGGYFYILDFAADKASERAQRLTEERLAQVDFLQQSLLENVGGSLREVGQVQGEIAQISEEVQRAKESIEALTGVAPERLEALSKMIERTTAESDLSVTLQAIFDRLGALEKALSSAQLTPPDLIEVGKVNKAASDGFIVVTAAGRYNAASRRTIEGFAGLRDPPRERRAGISISPERRGEQLFSFSMPVRRGEYFLIEDSAGSLLVRRTVEDSQVLEVSALWFGLELEQRN